MISLIPTLLAGALLAAAQTQPKTPPAPSAVEKIARSAEAARQANRIDEAIALYKKGLVLAPQWEDGWAQLGSAYYELDSFTEGRDAFRHLTVVDPKLGAGWALLGLCEFQTKQYDLALAHLQKGVELGVPADLSDVANYRLALLLTRFEEYEKAMGILGVFSQRDLAQADFVEAMGIASLRKPLLPSELAPADRQMVMDVGRAMYDAVARRASQAMAEFTILLDKYPDQPCIHYLFGSFLLNSDAARAMKEFKKEPPSSPSYVPATITIAAEYLRSEEYKSALPYAEKAVEIAPQSFAAHAVLGRTLTEGGTDVNRGVSELELARKLEPNSPQVRIALATAYTRTGRKEDAARERQEFQKLRKQQDANSAEKP